MTATNGSAPGDGNGSSKHPAVTGSRPVVLVRYRAGSAGETARTVRLVPLPPGGMASVASAFCGELLRAGDVEMVTPAVGMPCSLCAVSHIAGSLASPALSPAAAHFPDAPSAGADPTAGDYQAWGWPVVLRRDQLWLSLVHDAVALMVPVPLATEVAAILSTRRCPVPTLAHPYAPEHRIVLAGEPYPVTLPWPSEIHRIAGNVLLPPTTTPRGPLSWIHPPQPDSLRLCREIDILAAVRTALSHPQPSH